MSRPPLGPRAWTGTIGRAAVVLAGGVELGAANTCLPAAPAARGWTGRGTRPQGCDRPWQEALPTMPPRAPRSQEGGLQPSRCPRQARRGPRPPRAGLLVQPADSRGPTIPSALYSLQLFFISQSLITLLLFNSYFLYIKLCKFRSLCGLSCLTASLTLPCVVIPFIQRPLSGKQVFFFVFPETSLSLYMWQVCFQTFFLILLDFEN